MLYLWIDFILEVPKEKLISDIIAEEACDSENPRHAYFGISFITITDFKHFMPASNFCRLYQNINWNNEFFQLQLKKNTCPDEDVKLLQKINSHN
ncbi:hypothetical protein NC651_019869 [Populus alba x Populus x berolinensis]|nr:hypothetical protein NC651_019869 [Populus alba x Populus x berolinensis]